MCCGWPGPLPADLLFLPSFPPRQPEAPHAGQQGQGGTAPVPSARPGRTWGRAGGQRGWRPLGSPAWSQRAPGSPFLLRARWRTRTARPRWATAGRLETGAASRPVGACTWRHVEAVWLWPAMAQRLGTETALRDSVPCMHLESGDAAVFTCEGNSDAGMLRCCLSSANKSPVLTFYYYFLNIINEQSFPRRLVSFLKAWKKTEVCNLDSN